MRVATLCCTIYLMSGALWPMYIERPQLSAPREIKMGIVLGTWAIMGISVVIIAKVSK